MASNSTTASNQQPKELCRYYLNGCCRFGDSCFNSHDRSTGLQPSNICRYYLAGCCAYGSSCRYEHKRPTTNKIETNNTESLQKSTKLLTNLKTSTSTENKQPFSYFEALTGEKISEEEMKRLNINSESQLCPYYEKDIECPFDDNCEYIHGDICDLCQMACLHPFDDKQRETHRKECMIAIEKDMTEAFRVQCSQTKQCGICMETVWELEPISNQRFGILENCNHVFCLPCIRKWRASKSYENKIVKACPECRVKSDYVTPSRYWYENEDDKNKIIDEYKTKLKQTDCKYFKKGEGKCPFGNKCFYQHKYPDGTEAELPSPTQRRRLNRDGLLESFSNMVRIDFDTSYDDDDAYIDDDDDDDLSSLMDDYHIFQYLSSQFANTSNGATSNDNDDTDSDTNREFESNLLELFNDYYSYY